MKLNLPNNLSGLGFETSLWMYEQDSNFYHDYFRAYRTSQYQTADAEIPVPAAPETVLDVSGYSESATMNAQTSADGVTAAPAPAADNADALKILSLILIVAGRVL